MMTKLVTYVQKIEFFEVDKISEKVCRNHFSGSYSSRPRIFEVESNHIGLFTYYYTTTVSFIA